MTLLADVVAVSSEVAGTTSRSRKGAVLAELLQRLAADEVAIAVGFLSGVPRQGRVGVGYATVYGVEHGQAAAPTLTIGDLDVAVGEIAAASGPGSAGRRKQILGGLLGQATDEE